MLNNSELERIKDFAIEGLFEDGGHHKQWYLEEIVKMLGFDLKEEQKKISLASEDPEECNGDWEPGIPP